MPVTTPEPDAPARPWPARPPVYYGWVMVVLAAAAMVGTMPGRTNFLGVISKPLVDDPAFGLSEARFGWLNFGAVLLGAALCLPAGRAVDRVGVRAALAGVAAGLGAATVWMATVTDAAALFAALVLVRGLGQGALSVVALAMVGKWFTRRLGIAMAAFTVLLTQGFIAAALWLEGAVAADGWRGPWAAVGWGLVGLAAGGLLLARSTPEAVGVPPDGAAEGGPPAPRAGGTSRGGLPSPDPGSATPPAEPAGHPAALDLPAGQALRTRAFWVFTLSGALFNLVWSGITLYPKQLLLARGFPEADLSDLFKLFMGTLTFAGLPANLAGGWLARAVPVGKLLAGGMAALAGALAVFPLVTTAGAAAGYAALLGVAGGLVTVVYFAVYGAAFGRANLGLIQAAAQVVTVFASATGPVVLTACKDGLGSYDPFFFAAGGLALVFAAAGWVTRLPGDRGR